METAGVTGNYPATIRQGSGKAQARQQAIKTTSLGKYLVNRIERGNRMNEKSLLLDPTPDEIEKHNDLIANWTVAVVSAADFRKNYPENIVGRLIRGPATRADPIHCVA